MGNVFVQGLFSPRVYRHPTRSAVYFVLGDYYVGVGLRGDLDWYREWLSQTFTV